MSENAVKLLEARAGYWSSATLYSEMVELLIDQTEAFIGVSTEVPLSQSGRPVVRRGNRYFPTFVDLEVGSEKYTLFPETARELAKRLIEAAELAEAADEPDREVMCGHWAPCDCLHANSDRLTP